MRWGGLGAGDGWEFCRAVIRYSGKLKAEEGTDKALALASGGPGFKAQVQVILGKSHPCSKPPFPL